MAVIELAGLRKEYRTFGRPAILALDGLDLWRPTPPSVGEDGAARSSTAGGAAPMHHPT